MPWWVDYLLPATTVSRTDALTDAPVLAFALPALARVVDWSVENPVDSRPDWPWHRRTLH